MIGRLIIKATLAFLTSFALFGGDMPQRDLGEYTPPAELTYVETIALQVGNELAFGNLVMELPEGVTAEVIETTDDEMQDGQTIVLNGAQELVGSGYRGTGPFAPRIHIARYTVRYECEEALISTLLDLFQGVSLKCEYTDKESKEFAFLLKVGDGTYNYFVLVRDKDLYLIEEIKAESNYAFSELREQGKVKWCDSCNVLATDKILYGNDYSIIKVRPQEDMSFICYIYEKHKQTIVCFYLDGYFENYYMQYDVGWTAVNISDLIDINFDGYTDIAASNIRALIWNPVNKSFTMVEYPDDMPYISKREYFPKTKIIWCQDRDSLPNGRDYTQSLWQWDGLIPIKIRECIAEIRGDKVRIWAYEGDHDNVMFDESFTIKEWEDKSNENVKAVYRQFYNGLVPEGFFFHDVPDGEEKIPQELLDKIKGTMMKGIRLDTFKTMTNSIVLDDEEIYALAEENNDIRGYFACDWNPLISIMMKADVDNDGIDDVIYKLSGRGNGEGILFKGQADGTYRKTDTIGSTINENFTIIEYEGKNYLICTKYDCQKGFHCGFDVALYEDGVCVETAELMLYAENYELTLDCSGEDYAEYAKEVMQNAVSYYEKVERDGYIIGSAEETMQDGSMRTLCDIDNDGDNEWYYKNIEGGNAYVEQWLFFNDGNEGEVGDEGVALINKKRWERDAKEDYRSSVMLWVDNVDGEAVVSVIYWTGLQDFVIVGYVVNGSECREVYEISAAVVYGIKQQRETAK